MAGFTESGTTLEFPSENWFRFQQSKPYCDVSGFGFKEMDACFLETKGDGTKVFYAIELKDFTETNSLEESNMTKRIWDIVKKNVDTLQMYLSAKYQQQFGIELENVKSVDLHTNMDRAIFVTIVNVKPENVQLLQALKDKCQSKLCAYSRVWDGVVFTLMSGEQAKRRFTFVK